SIRRGIIHICHIVKQAYCISSWTRYTVHATFFFYIKALLITCIHSVDELFLISSQRRVHFFFLKFSNGISKVCLFISQIFQHSFHKEGAFTIIVFLQIFSNRIGWTFFVSYKPYLPHQGFQFHFITRGGGISGIYFIYKRFSLFF